MQHLVSQLAHRLVKFDRLRLKELLNRFHRKRVLLILHVDIHELDEDLYQSIVYIVDIMMVNLSDVFEQHFVIDREMFLIKFEIQRLIHDRRVKSRAVREESIRLNVLYME